MTTPADELHTAADKLRTLAQHATDGPWRGDDLDEVQSPVGQVARAIGGYGKAPYPNSRYIAVMHPGVGKALAKWLESWTGIDLYEAGALPEDAKHALAVARQINATA